MFRKILSLFCSLCLICGCASPNTQNTEQLTTLEGTAKGYGGDIKTTVTLKNNQEIIAIDFFADQETSNIGGEAIPVLIERIISAQSTDIDIVAGATLTSNGFLEAVNNALESGNVVLKENDASQSKEVETITLNTDVLIIGGGGAGLAASIEASRAGAKVILLESMAFLGGDTGRAGGGIEAAGTEFQKANGIEDKPEDFYDFIMSRGITYRNPNLLKTMTDESIAAVDFLAELGADMSQQVAGHGAPVPRAHRPAEGSAGANIVNPMIDALDDLGVVVYNDTRGTELTFDDNHVVSGAKAVSTDGSKEYTITAKSVVITTGNFASNNEMVAKYDNRLEGLGTNSSAGSLGDGITMGLSAGADLENMEVMRVRPNFPSKLKNFIGVSQEGVRFMDETNTSDTIFVEGEDRHIQVVADKKPGEKYYWAIMNKEDWDEIAADNQKYLVNDNCLHEKDSIEELAESINIDAIALKATIDKWNNAVANGIDEEFGRSTNMDQPIGDGPVVALQITPNVHNTAGGLRINESAEVLDVNEKPIANLFAGGEVTGGIHDGVSAVTDAIVFGRIAGLSAALNAIN